MLWQTRITPRQEDSESNSSDTSLVADCSVAGYRAATNVMQTGAGAWVISPVGLRAPVVESMRKMTMLLDSWLAASRNLPVGSMVSCAEFFPWWDIRLSA